MLVDQPTTNPSSYILSGGSQDRLRSKKLQNRAAPCQLAAQLLIVQTFRSLQTNTGKLPAASEQYLSCCGHCTMWNGDNVAEEATGRKLAESVQKTLNSSYVLFGIVLFMLLTHTHTHTHTHIYIYVVC